MDTVGGVMSIMDTGYWIPWWGNVNNGIIVGLQTGLIMDIRITMFQVYGDNKLHSQHKSRLLSRRYNTSAIMK